MLTVASDDAAKTALLYGAASTALAGLAEVLDTYSNLRIRHAERFGVIVLRKHNAMSFFLASADCDRLVFDAHVT